MARSSVRQVAVLYFGAKPVNGPTGTLLGGGVLLETGVHALGGPEHTGQLPIERISTAETDTALVARPDGAGGVALVAAPTIEQVLLQGPDAGGHNITNLSSLAVTTYVDAGQLISDKEVWLGGVSGLMVTGGAADPSAGAGYVATVGSLYVRSNGELWQKTGAGNTVWTKRF